MELGDKSAFPETLTLGLARIVDVATKGENRPRSRAMPFATTTEESCSVMGTGLNALAREVTVVIEDRLERPGRYFKPRDDIDDAEITGVFVFAIKRGAKSTIDVGRAAFNKAFLYFRPRELIELILVRLALFGFSPRAVEIT
jgi:hypothetical protein